MDRTPRATVLGYSHVCGERWAVTQEGNELEITTEGGTLVTGVVCLDVAQHVVTVHNAALELSKALADTNR